MEQITAGAETFTIARATSQDLPSIVALLTDDVLGAGREAADLSPYAAAFAEIDADPNQFLAVVRDSASETCGTFQLTLIPGLARGGTKRLQVEAVRLGSSTR